MKERIITAVVLIAVLLGSVFLGPIAVQALVSLFLAVGAYEVYRTRRTKVAPIVLIPYVLFVLGAMLIPESLYVVYVSAILLVFFIMAVVFKWYTLDELSFSFLMIVMLVTTAVAFKRLLEIDMVVLIYPMIAAFGADTCAFFGGKMFGKTKLIPRLSPNKTVEGAIAGYVGGVILSFVFAYFVVQAHIDLIPLVVASLLMPILSQLGDLSFSLVKRRYDIKDFGHIFPGHGGVLDRIDSLVFAILTLNIVLSVLVG
ncbi:phosphatidate cytidylyltransferase [Erysipelothrix urinaevulpis]|uniref:phosphatidate cytidylyltransferase n=1 Tax=Erysipelothrix urinaevulpis TaxID=2683717 RepID=UPI001359EFD7|nr:phosphatidate cytidylyltransferase [Erysipelothrix urinaevulpis]